MADKLGLGSETRELKIGQSFTNPKAQAFHTIRYDFKPASVDVNKMAVVDVGNTNQVTVTVPHLDGAGVPQTVFKGSQRPCQKECVLVIDRITGEITLEKLSNNIQVKKTRSEAVSKPVLHPSDRNSQGADKAGGGTSAPSNNSNNRPQTPPMVGQRNTSRTKVTSGARKAERHITHLVPKHSPLHASPNYNNNSSMTSRSPKRAIDFHAGPTDPSHNTHSALASLPRLGGTDDYVAHTPPNSLSLQQRTVANPYPPPHHGNSNPTFEQSPTFVLTADDNGVEEMSDSSSSSSSSDSDSDHDRTPVNRAPPAPPANAHRTSTNGYPNSSGASSHNRSSNASSKISSLPSPNVFDDLQLSEDDSD